MTLCGLPWRRRRRTVPEASLAPGNGGAALSGPLRRRRVAAHRGRAARLYEAPAAALPSHPVSPAVYSAAVCMCVKALQTSLPVRLPQQLQYRDRVESPAMFSLLTTALQV